MRISVNILRGIVIFVLMSAGLSLAGTEAPDVVNESYYTVVLVDPGIKKIELIKQVRAITGFGLKAAKDLVDTTPQAIKTRVSEQEAEALKKQLEEAGGRVEIKKNPVVY